LKTLRAHFRSTIRCPNYCGKITSRSGARPKRLYPQGYRQHLIGCEVFVLLINEGRLIGFLAIGRRLSGEPYSSDDLDFLSAVASKSALAFENARLFENLRRTLDGTREMKNMKDNIFTSIATGVITTDLDHKITLFNRAAENIFGLPLENVLGKSLYDALPSLNPALDQVVTNVITQGETSSGHELNSRSLERGDLFLRLSATHLRDAYSATKGATLVFENLTETRKLEAESELIRHTFGRLEAPRVRDRLLADAGNLQLHGIRKTVTMLFADLGTFTSLSAKNSPETVFTLLNSYLDIVAQVILENEGTLDKFMAMQLWRCGIRQITKLIMRHVPAVQPWKLCVEHPMSANDSRRVFPGPNLALPSRLGLPLAPPVLGMWEPANYSITLPLAILSTWPSGYNPARNQAKYSFKKPLMISSRINLSQMQLIPSR